MECLYRIVGVRAIGNRICLTISMVEGSKEFNTTKILGNLGGFMENMKNDALNSRNPDQISINVDEFKKGFYNIGDVISLKIDVGGK